MVEIYNKLKVLSYEKNDIEMDKNAPSIIGCTISDGHRLLYYTRTQQEAVFVDFIAQASGSQELIFIPARHVLYFPETDRDYYCIHIPSCCLSELQHIYLLDLIYKKIKTIKIHRFSADNFDLNDLFHQLFDADLLFHRSLPPLQYVYKAIALLNVLAQTNFDFHFTINDLAASIHVSTKTLSRICRSVFKSSPAQILHYHLQLKIIFRIITHKLHPFSEIADDLKCSDVSAFGRYVKSMSGLTPGAIRNKFAHIHL